MDDWIYYEPDTSKIYTIGTFDDGNEKYKYYTNRWHVFGKWRGKVALVNAENQTIKISSISDWKTIAIASYP
jgi:hypothetical protein